MHSIILWNLESLRQSEEAFLQICFFLLSFRIHWWNITINTSKSLHYKKTMPYKNINRFIIWTQVIVMTMSRWQCPDDNVQMTLSRWQCPDDNVSLSLQFATVKNWRNVFEYSSCIHGIISSYTYSCVKIMN